MPQYCPSCGDSICPPSGNSKQLLIVGDAPDRMDMMKKHPFSIDTWRTTPGKVLRKELERMGASLNEFRACYLWLHETTRSGSCWQAGYDNVLTEAKGKKAILLMGAEVVSTFTQYKVSDVSGLQVDSPILSASIIYAMISPGLAIQRSLGEVRFAITQFVNRLYEERLL